MLTRPSILAALFLATLPLGCSTQPETALIDPAKFRFHTCAQLQREMIKLRDRAEQLRALYDRAQRDSTVVARVAYEADYLTTTGDMQTIESEARERKCDPSVTAAAPLSAPASAPAPAPAR